jgi:hypothetical protein
MPVYTVHEPPRRDEDTLAHTARFAFVRDGFHWWAFWLAPLWMLRHRLWLEFIAFGLIVVGVTFALRRFGATSDAVFWVYALVALLVGMEASSLRRWKLARRGFEYLGVVVGDDIEEAERRFFDGWVARSDYPASSATAIAPSPFGAPATTEIVGLFPQPEARP